MLATYSLRPLLHPNTRIQRKASSKTPAWQCIDWRGGSTQTSDKKGTLCHTVLIISNLKEMNTILTVICRIKHNITSTPYQCLHAHSRIYKNAPNVIDTKTHIVAWTQSQNTKPQIRAIQQGSEPTNTQKPGKSANLEEEPYKSLTVTGVKQNWKPQQEETACEAGGKPVVTVDSIETWWSLGNNIANPAHFYFCYSEPYDAFQMLRWTSFCIHKFRHPVLLLRRIIY